MILFINTFITDKLIPGRTNDQRANNRIFLNQYSSYDVFRYSLASLSKAFNWKRVVLKILLDSNYESRKDELKSFIEEEFKGIPIHLYWNRNVYQKDWQETFELFDDELIWFSCNHDHIFLDSSQEYLNSLVSKMMNEADGLISSCYTHWPEQIAYVSDNKSPQDLKVYDDYATMNMINVDSINIISKSLYKKWWFSNKLSESMIFPRTDWPDNMIFRHVDCGSIQKNFIPFKELSRHFDGYYHLDMHQCPALNIPYGFFDNRIRIWFGESKPVYDKNQLWDWTWMHPSVPTYRAENGEGVEYKNFVWDRPISWKDRIAYTALQSTTTEQMYVDKMKSIVDMLSIRYHTEPMRFKQEILNNIISVWFRSYEYQPR